MKKPGIKSKGEAHKHVTILELNIHKRETAEVGKGGTLSLSTRLTLYVGCAAQQYPEKSLQIKTISSQGLQTEAALSICPLPEPPHHRDNPGLQLPW